MCPDVMNVSRTRRVLPHVVTPCLAKPVGASEAHQYWIRGLEGLEKTFGCVVAIDREAPLRGDAVAPNHRTNPCGLVVEHAVDKCLLQLTQRHRGGPPGNG